METGRSLSPRSGRLKVAQHFSAGKAMILFLVREADG